MVVDVDDMKTFNEEYEKVYEVLEAMESCYVELEHFSKTLDSDEIREFCKDLVDNPTFNDEIHQVDALEMSLESTYEDNEERINEADSIDRLFDRKMWEDDRL